jgi:hypothetical protein
MATHEEELKQINADIELLEAELVSNIEEIDRINPLEGHIKRERYLRIRSAYIEDKLKILIEKREGKIKVIDWEKRTR